MDPLTADQLSGGHQISFQLASGCHDLLELIYQRDTAGELDYGQLMGELTELTHQSSEQLEGHMNEAFKQLCDLAEEYGLPHQVISPSMSESDDEALDDLTRRLAYYVHSREHRQSDKTAAENAPAKLDKQSLWMEQQLQYLQQITDLINEQANASQLSKWSSKRWWIAVGWSVPHSACWVPVVVNSVCALRLAMTATLWSSFSTCVRTMPIAACFSAFSANA